MKHERTIEPPEQMHLNQSTGGFHVNGFPGTDYIKTKKRKSIFRLFLQFISMTIYIIGLITCIKYIIGLC